MQNNKDIIENNNVCSPIADMEKPIDNSIEPNTCPYGNPRANLYSLCIGCPDWPRHCNGPSLYEFLDIMLVRNFARKIRDFEKIKNKQIADKISHVVSEATVAEFFSNKVKDFMWTTTAYIFHGLKLAVLEKRLGTNFDPDLVLDNPCPASSSKIQEMMASKDAEILNLQKECLQLRKDLEACNMKRREQKEKTEIQQTSIKEEDQRKIDHLLAQVKYLEERAEYLKDTAERRYGLIVDRDNKIASIQKSNSAWRMFCIILLMIIAVMAVLLTMYIVWDFTHDGKGIFW